MVAESVPVVWDVTEPVAVSTFTESVSESMAPEPVKLPVRLFPASERKFQLLPIGNVAVVCQGLWPPETDAA
jgi:hypothetical protein